MMTINNLGLAQVQKVSIVLCHVLQTYGSKEIGARKSPVAWKQYTSWPGLDACDLSTIFIGMNGNRPYSYR